MHDSHSDQSGCVHTVRRDAKQDKIPSQAETALPWASVQIEPVTDWNEKTSGEPATADSSSTPSVHATAPAQNEPKSGASRRTRSRAGTRAKVGGRPRRSSRSPKRTRPRNPCPASLPHLTPAQQRLAAEHIGLVGVHLRTRVPTPRTPTRDRERDDLFQEGCIGLLRAAALYNPRTDGPFPAFALPRIRGAVFAAIHEQFTMLRVPLREACKARTADQADAPPVVVPLDDTVGLAAIQTFDPETSEDGDNLRHAVRRRFERAVRLALRDLAQQSWRKHDPIRIFKRLADERLLISDDTRRTSLRHIARDERISSSRICACEKKLNNVVGDHLARDVQVALLFEFAKREPDGFLARLTPDHRRQLMDAELDAFDGHFRRLDRARQSELVYRMLEQSSPMVPEVAKNLYRLTVCDDFDIAAVA